MKIVRKYGNPPFKIVLVHGGPGAPGSIAPVAKKLSKSFSVLEPFQTKDSVSGQVSELRNQIKKYAQVPVTLIGHSWGAWLSLMLTSKHPGWLKN